MASQNWEEKNQIKSLTNHVGKADERLMEQCWLCLVPCPQMTLPAHLKVSQELRSG